MSDAPDLGERLRDPWGNRPWLDLMAEAADALDAAAAREAALVSLVERLATSVTFWHAHADVDAHHNAPPPLPLLAEARAALSDEATDG